MPRRSTASVLVAGQHSVRLHHHVVVKPPWTVALLSEKHYYTPVDEAELRRALTALGALCERPAEILLAGGAALVLAGHTTRGTDDGDVVAATPPLTELAGHVARVARELALVPTWLNDNVSRYADALPADYRDRCIEIGTFGLLTVSALGRNDLILLKLLALRAQDMDDLDALRPTDAELGFVVWHLPRLAERYPDRVVRIRYYLDGPGVRPLDSGYSGGSAIRRRP